jgi:hypothetical protein
MLMLACQAPLPAWNQHTHTHTHTHTWLTIRRAQAASCSVCSVAGRQAAAGLTLPTNTVLALPPNDSCAEQPQHSCDLRAPGTGTACLLQGKKHNAHQHTQPRTCSNAVSLLLP